MSVYAYNLCVKAEQEELAAFLRDREFTGLVTKPQDGYCLAGAIFVGDDKVLRDTAAAVSEHFSRPCFAAFNYDDSHLFYWLYDKGQLLDEYVSAPNRRVPGQYNAVGNPELLCSVLAGDDQFVGVVRAILTSAIQHSLRVPNFFAKLRARDAELPADMPRAERDTVLAQYRRELLAHPPEPDSDVAPGPFALAVNALPLEVADAYSSRFIDALAKGGVGQSDVADQSIKRGFASERQRHAALVAALKLPGLSVSLCGDEEPWFLTGSIEIGEE